MVASEQFFGPSLTVVASGHEQPVGGAIAEKAWEEGMTDAGRARKVNHG